MGGRGLVNGAARTLARVAAVALVAGLLMLLVWRLVDRSRGGGLVDAVAEERAPRAPAFDLPVLWARGETWPPGLRPALADGRVALSELQGSPVVVNFWASWCVPCKEEAGRLNAGALRHRGTVAFVGVDIQDFKSDARKFLRRYRVNYPSLRDSGDRTYSDYGLTGIPETYFLDGRGRIVRHVVGAVTAGDLEQGIRSARRSQ